MTTIVAVDLAGTVKRLRQNRGMSQRELCEASIRPDNGRPLSHAYVGMVERGDRARVSLVSLYALAAGLEVDPEWLIAEANVNEKGL